ncbi:hypothetical protein ACLI09_13170 [Flavobacterium sp. RHBU_24]|uniref:hypothetical protein n=1 Tax=Flavobacterium sp. RHBU_24 TaxID=3391185 RepID=UPI003984883A
MVSNNMVKGVLLVGLGAASYGLLATFVKMAYAKGYTTAEVTVSQMVLGIVCVAALWLFQKSKQPKDVKRLQTIS